MLVLKRKTGERVVVPEWDLVVTVIAVSGTTVRLGISAPKDLAVYREELWRLVRKQGRALPPKGRGG